MPGSGYNGSNSQEQVNKHLRSSQTALGVKRERLSGEGWFTLERVVVGRMCLRAHPGEGPGGGKDQRKALATPVWSVTEFKASF